MSKGIRFIIAVILLLGVLFLARSQAVLAGNWSWQNNVIVQGQSAPASLDANNRPGTVKPPPVVAPPITRPGTYPVGGICTLQVNQISNDVSLRALVLPFEVLKSPPQDVKRYLAGVCSLTYQKSGKPITDLTPEDGNVKICFAALPNITATIYVYDDNQVWTALETTLADGLECATASKTGKYVLARQP